MRPDIVWFLLDGVRPDRVKICGGDVDQTTFIDDALSQGTLFTQSIAAGPYSLIALNAMFTSLYGTTNGVNAAYKTTSDDLHPDAATVTDLLRSEGYTTLCYAGSPFEPIEPVPSFDVYRLAPALDGSVLEEIEAAPHPRFVSLSFQHVHDACCNAPQSMTAEAFDRAIREIAEQFEPFYRRLAGPDVLAMVFSDHGMRLRDRVDPDWDWEAHPEQEPTTGVYVTDHTIRTFAALIHPELFPRRVVRSQVRSVDMVPTILDALGMPPIGGQGESLWPEVSAGTEPPERVAYSETGGRWFSPWRPNVRCVRTNRWKFTRHDDLGEALHDLERDPGEAENLLGRGLPEEDRLRAELDAQLLDLERPPAEHYAKRGVDHAELLRARPPRAAVPELSKGMNAYEGMGVALADEDLAAARDHARELVRLAEREAEKAERAGRDDERGAFAFLSTVAADFAGAGDLAAARAAFGRLSQLVIAFVGRNPAFHESLVTYECSAVPGYKKWVQKRNDDRLVNPYLGRDSLAPVRETEFVP